MSTVYDGSPLKELCQRDQANSCNPLNSVRNLMDYTNVSSARAVRRRVRRTGGTRMNIWGLLHSCRPTDG